MTRDQSLDKIDPSLARRLLGLSRGSQRWLKTALQTVRTMPPAHEVDVDKPAATGRPTPQMPSAPSGFEDVIEGRTNLEEQLEAYPELADELEGLGDIIDMLRDAGEQRRKKGDQILRDEILGRPDKRDEEEDDLFNGSPA